MKVLIFGAGGMIGHKMFQVLRAAGHDVAGTLRRDKSVYRDFNIFDGARVVEGVDVANFDHVERVLDQLEPEVILNCIGITLRKPEISDYKYSKLINTDFPHFLQLQAEKRGAYLIHFSTDCVFSGNDGPYSEISAPSALDIYGKTKAGGEVVGPSSLTLRGSMIGRELHGKSELLEWALSQKGKSIKGFSHAIYSGVTTLIMAELVVKILKLPKKPTGLYHVSSAPISKYNLLLLINEKFQLGMTITPDPSYKSQKVLLHDKIAGELGFVCPTWPEMIDQLVQDSFQY